MNRARQNACQNWIHLGTPSIDNKFVQNNIYIYTYLQTTRLQVYNDIYVYALHIYIIHMIT